MVSDVKAIVTDSVNPFYNISLESRIIDVCDKKTVYMYLWRNDNTVVVGKFQNAFKECKVNELEGDGGHLLRRLTGGGAVYHDVNNLNFTFVAHKDNYDLKKQQYVILKAIKKLGLDAQLSGRNDITIDGKKFSGNSFLTRGDVKMHNGTILIDTDREKMMKYLTVSQAKMQSKGVDSVKSRTVNLTEYVPNLTTGKMAILLLKSFGDVYDLPVQLIKEESLNCDEIEKIRQEIFQNDKFRFGTNPAFTNSINGRFAWGEAEVKYSSQKGVIDKAEIFTDALDTEEIEKTKQFLIGKNIADMKKFKLDGQSQILIDIVGLF